MGAAATLLGAARDVRPAPVVTWASPDVFMNFVMAGVYLLLAVGALTLLFMLLRFHKLFNFPLCRAHPRRQLFCLIIFTASVVRLIWFMIQPLIMMGEMAIEHALNVLLNFLPTHMFISVYTLLLSLLADVYYYHREKGVQRRVRLAIGIYNAVMYAGVLATTIVSFILTHQTENQPHTLTDPTDEASTYILVGEFVIIAIVFAVFGIRLRRRTSLVAPKSAQNRLLRRLAWATGLSTVAFVIRCVLIIVTAVQGLEQDLVMVICYYFFLEVVPLSVVLFLFGRPPPPPTVSFQPLS